MPEEHEAAKRLREILKINRAMAPSNLLYQDQDVGYLLCAVGRIDYMERHAERLAKSDDPAVARTAKIILGWEKDGGS